ncbi:TetR/AcrR family transcriptional regulator [Sinosporangium album]|uniref:TetR/AcrR family transcriptional regulator n=1 Tax=Sinosporangium album TaxID=504805 RepID=UPI000B8310FF|nr:TetR/AcrR family transcriptional regulator [Sinosporangium album]
MKNKTRRRPEYRSGRPTLTREAIGRAVLDLVADSGPAALNMRALAARLGVTARALYNYVDDRDDAVRCAAMLVQAELHLPPLDPPRWRDSVRELCGALRAWYARFPNSLRLIDAGVQASAHPHMLANNEQIFAFYRAIGISPAKAGLAWAVTITTIAGHSEIDAWYGRLPDTEAEEWAPTPRGQLDAHPELDLAHTFAVHAAGPDLGREAVYESTVDMLILWLDALRNS